jgi:glycosyltransferase involved in cell wall biosynthesis
MSPPRALFVINAAWFFVAQRMAPALALRERGVDVHVTCAPDTRADVERIVGAGFQYHPLNLSRRGMNPFRELLAIVQLARLYRALRPDWVHHITIKPVIYGGLAARLARVPSVISAISGMGYVFIASGRRARLLRAGVRAAYRAAFRHPDSTVIFENPDDRATFVDAGLLDASRAVLIRGVGVDLDRFRPAQRPEREPVVVLPGRMLRDKGVLEYVEAGRLLAERGVGVTLALVGDTDPGNPAAIPRDRLEEWAAAGHVEWWGWQPDMAAAYARADIVCLPSYREGLPTTLVEAGACGLPVVATDVPGCREVVRHGETGLLVPPRDPVALADAIARLARDHALRQRMGAAGRDAVERHYSTRQVVEQTLDVYRRSRALA